MCVFVTFFMAFCRTHIFANVTWMNVQTVYSSLEISSISIKPLTVVFKHQPLSAGIPGVAPFLGFVGLLCYPLACLSRGRAGAGKRCLIMTMKSCGPG